MISIMMIMSMLQLKTKAQSDLLKVTQALSNRVWVLWSYLGKSADSILRKPGDMSVSVHGLSGPQKKMGT